MIRTAVSVFCPASLLWLAACASAPPPAPRSSPAAPVAAAPATAPEPPAPPPAAGPSVEERRHQLAALLDEQWQYVLRTNPEFASVLGDRRYNDQWRDASPAAIAADLAKSREFLARFTAIDTAGFPDQEALNQQLMVRNLRRDVDDARFEDWLMPVNQMSGVQLGLAQVVSALPFATVKDYDDYIARLGKIPEVFAQTTELLKQGVAKHLVPPRFLLEQCVRQTEGMTAGKPDDSAFAAPLKKFPAEIGQTDRDRIRTAVLAAIRDRIVPAYRAFATYLRIEYVPHGRTEVGVWSLPDGDARYAAAVKDMTTTDMTPDQIHELGLREVARIEVEQTTLAKQLGFADLAALRRHVRGDKKLYGTTGEAELARFKKYEEQMYGKLPELFGRLPKQRLVVERMEPFREKEATSAEYDQGTQDGSRPGKVLVNYYAPTKRMVTDEEAVAYHEGVPGHHLQIAIQQELRELPPFRQQSGYTAFVEGWALYSERVGKEAGFYQDPYSDYGRLQAEMWRAIRLVVDTGLHAKHWSRAQVVQFFHDHSTIDEPNVQAETNRYIAWPGQALAYKIGQLTILRLREKARGALGERFDIKVFHDQVLGAGAVPMDVLDHRIDAWIAATAATAAK